MHNDNNKFSYTYSAPTEEEKCEVESIRRQYTAKTIEEDKMARLRRLHRSVVGHATALSLAVGIVGILVFGLGLSLVLEFGKLTWGIIISLIGLCPTTLAYPIYNLAIKHGKTRYGDEIIRISNEILGKEREK